jgi:hypothetical protein
MAHEQHGSVVCRTSPSSTTSRSRDPGTPEQACSPRPRDYSSANGSWAWVERLDSPADRTPLLRQEYVDRMGHWAFTDGEVLAAIETITYRIGTGHWPRTDAKALNARDAARLHRVHTRPGQTGRAVATPNPAIHAGIGS